MKGRHPMLLALVMLCTVMLPLCVEATLNPSLPVVLCNSAAVIWRFAAVEPMPMVCATSAPWMLNTAVPEVREPWKSTSHAVTVTSLFVLVTVFDVSMVSVPPEEEPPVESESAFRMMNFPLFVAVQVSDT